MVIQSRAHTKSNGAPETRNHACKRYMMKPLRLLLETPVLSSLSLFMCDSVQEMKGSTCKSELLRQKKKRKKKGNKSIKRAVLQRQIWSEHRLPDLFWNRTSFFLLKPRRRPEEVKRCRQSAQAKREREHESLCFFLQKACQWMH